MKSKGTAKNDRKNVGQTYGSQSQKLGINAKNPTM
jgi:hypothetical protein